MSKIYSEEEKRTHLDQYKVSGKTKTEYARDNSIAEATFRAWVKEEKLATYGLIETETGEEIPNQKIVKPTIFANENIRIEIRDGYDKEFLRRIVEVLINDSKITE